MTETKTAKAIKFMLEYGNVFVENPDKPGHTIKIERPTNDKGVPLGKPIKFEVDADNKDLVALLDDREGISRV